MFTLMKNMGPRTRTAYIVSLVGFAVFVYGVFGGPQLVVLLVGLAVWVIGMAAWLVVLRTEPRRNKASR